MRIAWTRRLLTVLVAAPICVALTWLWMRVDSGFVATLVFFAFLMFVVAPLAGRIAQTLVRS